jgi:hypothetical protein
MFVCCSLLCQCMPLHYSLLHLALTNLLLLHSVSLHMNVAHCFQAHDHIQLNSRVPQTWLAHALQPQLYTNCILEKSSAHTKVPETWCYWVEAKAWGCGWVGDLDERHGHAGMWPAFHPYPVRKTVYARAHTAILNGRFFGRLSLMTAQFPICMHIMLIELISNYWTYW